jgi:glycosyltransferase involved in cell wall biosynthesis
LRITFVSPKPGLSGGTRVVATHAKNLLASGHEVTVVSTPASPPPPWRRIRRFLSTQHLRRDHLMPWTNPTKLVDREASHFDGVDVPHLVIDRFRPIIDRDVPDGDVVIATWWETAEWVSALSPRKGTKAYFVQHHELFDYSPIERVKATYRLPLQKITISKWLVELLSREYGNSKVRLVPNSVDTVQFHAEPRGRQHRPTVGLLYSTLKWKGVDLSLRAIEKTCKRISGLSLVAFGAEPLTSQLPLPTGTNFHLRPAQNMLRTIYSSCDVWLCGSYSEGFHLPPLEAMACRCPVVSTSVGGPIDIIEPGYNGYLVPVGDSDALADRLFDVLSFDDARWRAMSDAALATATKYSWEDATKLLEGALREIIDSAV